MSTTFLETACRCICTNMDMSASYHSGLCNTLMLYCILVIHIHISYPQDTPLSQQAAERREDILLVRALFRVAENLTKLLVIHLNCLCVA